MTAQLAWSLVYGVFWEQISTLPAHQKQKEVGVAAYLGRDGVSALRALRQRIRVAGTVCRSLHSIGNPNQPH